jgi:16S rRNA G966 N2-methylase RsmD
MGDPQQILASLWEASAFRRGVHLNAAERAELEAIGLEAAAERSRPLIEARLAPAQPRNDGRQTPWHGYLTFPAQHATATCCRSCLAKHHGIPAGVPLSGQQVDYVLACLQGFWERELAEPQPCECRSCSRPGAASYQQSGRRRTRQSGSIEGSPRLPELAGNLGGEASSEDPPAPSEAPVTTGYNDLDLRRWKDYPEIETGSLWLFPGRERGGGHQLEYHGNFIPQIATQTFQRFSREGEVVLDLFLGAGTSAIEAARLGRRCIGVELKPELAEYVAGRLANEVAAGQVAVVQGDSRTDETAARVREQLAAWGEERAHLLVLHPPYHDIIRFSEREEDLSNAATTEAFLEMFEAVARRGRELLAPGRFAVLVIGDKYTRGELVPLGFRCMETMNRAGFRTRSIVVKNIEGNEIGKGRTNNLWRYRALRGGFYLFKHEYVIVFQNPA